MTAIKHWLATLSVFAFGGITYTAADAKTVSVAEIERACERALRANTVEALEDFLHKYPAKKYRNDVACYALALGALNEFGNDEDKRNNNDKDPGGPGDGNYAN
jgi:hypothetical protein